MCCITPSQGPKIRTDQAMYLHNRSKTNYLGVLQTLSKPFTFYAPFLNSCKATQVDPKSVCHFDIIKDCFVGFAFYLLMHSLLYILKQQAYTSKCILLTLYPFQFPNLCCLNISSFTSTYKESRVLTLYVRKPLLIIKWDIRKRATVLA